MGDAKPSMPKTERIQQDTLSKFRAKQNGMHRN